MTLFVLPKMADFEAVEGSALAPPSVVMYVAGADSRVMICAVYPDNLIYHSPPNSWMAGALEADVIALYPDAVKVSVLALIS